MSLIRLTKRRTGVHGTKTTVDGFVFDSKAEANRYGELVMMRAAHAISDLAVHPTFPLLTLNRGVVGVYEADFSYLPEGETERVVEEVKGAEKHVRPGKKKRWTSRTAIYRWKKRHFELQYDKKITEVERG